ncbi:MAG: alpha/beta hydrolase [Lapillicoccus sp.]
MSSSGPESSTRRRRSAWRAIVGSLWILVAGVCAVLSRGSLLAGHPAYPVLLAVCVVVGLWLVGTGLRPVPADRPRHRVATVVGRGLAALLSLVVLGSLVYLVPATAEPGAVAAMAGAAAVRVSESPTRITLTPGRAPAAGLVFQPGAKVDPRAYVPLLQQVSAAGYLVVVVKQPVDIGFLAIGDPADVIAGHPEVTRWAVGGHSLGGVAAGVYAARPDTGVRGLLFWASYPLTSLADRTDLVVASVSGTADGLSTPADIEASRAKLPPAAVFTAVPGGVHAYFGDYGPQAGDGTATIDRAAAQQQIVAATTTFLLLVASS